MELIKTLTRNDVGETGGHQSGVTIPLSVAKGGFFPSLDVTELNPREVLDGYSSETGTNLRMNYIYYNGKLHGVSTRNEYRLTGIAPFLRVVVAREGDKLIFTRHGDMRYEVRHESKSSVTLGEEIVITLTKDWSTRERRK